MTIDTDSPSPTSAADSRGAGAPGPADLDETTGWTDWVSVARRLGEALAPGVAQRDRDGELCLEAFDDFRSTGLTAALVPVEFGGGGAPHREVAAALRELGRHDPATAVALSMHTHLVATQVWRHHQGMDAERVFRKVVDDRAVLLSTGASDWAPSNGTVRRVDGGYRVTATKTPVSGCGAGDVVVSSARWDDAPDGPQVIHFSVPVGADGVSLERTWDTLGMRATGSDTVRMDDVMVPDAAVSLMRPADGWPGLLNVVVIAAMPLILSAYLGAADEAVRLACAAVRDPSDPISQQLVGEMLDAHTTAVDVVDAMVRAADGLAFEASAPDAARALSRKTVAAEAMVATVRLGLEAVGGRAFSRTSDLERLYRDVHGSLFHPLPRARQARFTGRVALGLDPLG
jgi:alkylation response protein AidB-like acyl-CoA dehydrogenase